MRWLTSKGVIGGLGLILFGGSKVVTGVAEGGELPVDGLEAIAMGLGILGIRMKQPKPGRP